MAKKKSPSQVSDRYHQLDLLEYLERVNQVLVEPLPATFAELATAIEQEMLKATVPGKGTPHE